MRSWRSSSPSSTSKPEARRVDWRSLARLLAEDPLSRLATLAPEAANVALVGGAVRDTLLGRAPTDLDLVVEQGFDRYLDAIELARGARPSDIGDTFQHTHRFRWKGVQVDIARAQGSLDEDLGRRDFSVNALALPLGRGRDPESSLVDPYGGLADLIAGRLRETTPGVLTSDPLRALRAVRYAAELPGFGIEAATAAAISATAQRLTEVAPERVQTEWSLNLGSPGWRRALRIGSDLGVCGPSLGELSTSTAVDAWALAESELGLDAPQLRGRLGALILDMAAGASVEAVVARLLDGRWPPAQVQSADRVARWASTCAGATPAQLATWALRDPGAAADASALASRLDPASPADELRRDAQRSEEARWVTGDDLIAWGMPAGPPMGRLLRDLALGQITRRWPAAADAREWARGQLEQGRQGRGAR